MKKFTFRAWLPALWFLAAGMALIMLAVAVSPRLLDKHHEEYVNMPPQPELLPPAESGAKESDTLTSDELAEEGEMFALDADNKVAAREAAGKGKKTRGIGRGQDSIAEHRTNASDNENKQRYDDYRHLAIQNQLASVSQDKNQAFAKTERSGSQINPVPMAVGGSKPKPDKLVLEQPMQRQKMLSGLGQTIPNGKLSSEQKFYKPAPPPPGFIAFHEQRNQVSDLQFKEASGYWENTYVPGDPLLRYLNAGLRRYKPAYQLSPQTRLEQVWQPFDAPGDAALALYLHTDKTSIQGPTRLLAQVGLQGSLRHSGRRPAMNVAIVLDLGATLTAGESAAIRALLNAFVAARRSTDNFSLTVAGRPGGTVLEPDEFRHGPLQVALPLLFGSNRDNNGPLLNVAEAAQEAVNRVKNRGKSDTLGGSAVIFVATRSTGSYTGTLENLAHHSAVNGTPFSVIIAAKQVPLDEMEHLTVIGQGNRRFLRRADEADSLVDRELHAAGRAVARALRLNIRLLPGVKLVDVIGSKNLDEHRSTRMREAEQSIDRRLAKTLGIARDRGQDEDGIQIVIPAYYAGDSHVVLLDLVAENPGPLVEVTVRYKDLVYLRNGVARALLHLDGRDKAPGPLERNVLKNLLASRLAAIMRRAGEYLENNRSGEAHTLLENYQKLLVSIQTENVAWQNDPELAQDRRMLDACLTMLQDMPENQVEQRMYLADSLQYAGFMKVLPAREEH